MTHSLPPLALVKGAPMPPAWAETSGGRLTLSLSKGVADTAKLGFDRLSPNGVSV